MAVSQTPHGPIRDQTLTNRRSVLRNIGVVSIVGLAGCLGDSNDTHGGCNNTDEERSRGTAEITFRGERYTVDGVTCDGRRAFPPENELMGFRRPQEELEFFVERDMGGDSDGIEVMIGFPSGGLDETIGEIEAYNGFTTFDQIEFELGKGTSGSLHLEPYIHMNDDVDHYPDGGQVEWNFSC